MGQVGAQHTGVQGASGGRGRQGAGLAGQGSCAHAQAQDAWKPREIAITQTNYATVLALSRTSNLASIRSMAAREPSSNSMECRLQTRLATMQQGNQW